MKKTFEEWHKGYQEEVLSALERVRASELIDLLMGEHMERIIHGKTKKEILGEIDE